MRFRITTFAQDGTAISQGPATADHLQTVLHMLMFSEIDADVTRLVIDELGEDGEPVTKTGD